jgi:hypothetical protein
MVRHKLGRFGRFRKGITSYGHSHGPQAKRYAELVGKYAARKALGEQIHARREILKQIENLDDRRNRLIKRLAA